MNRTQKKCIVASAGFHLSLLLLLLVGPAFLSPDRKSEDRPLLDFVPLKTIDEAFSGGGNPNARPPQAAPPPPAPQPQPPQPQRAVEPPEPPRPAPREPETFSTRPAKKLPDVSLKEVVRKPKNTGPARSPSNAADERRAQLAAAARQAVQNLREGLASSTTVEMPGPGGGGVPYANFLDAVKKIYSDAWIVPDGVTDDEATTTASVTIARDGTVLSAKIIRRSGNGLADASVEAALRRVTFAVPLPDSAKENQRTVTIKFNVKAKRGLG
jgi:TonB family protein